MSRFKFAVGLLVLAGVSILIATAFLSPGARWRRLSDSGRKATEQGRPAEPEPLSKRALLIREKSLPAEESETASILKSIPKLSGESGRTAETNEIRIKKKQIKMH